MSKPPVLDDNEDQPDGEIELSPRLRGWIDKRVKGYHTRKASSKTTAQYKAGLEYSAHERLEIAFQQGLSENDAEDIVFQALGKSSGVFHMLLLARISRDRDIQKTRADTQEPLIEQLKVGAEQIHESNMQMREFMSGMGSMMKGMMESIENIAKLQITHEPKKQEEGEPQE